MMIVEGYKMGGVNAANIREILTRHDVKNVASVAKDIMAGKVVSLENDPYLREDLKEMGVFCS